MGEKAGFGAVSDKSDTHFENRTGGTFGAYVNIVCVVAGTGTLGLPYTLHQGGWVAAAMFMVVAVMCLFTSHLFIQCLYCREGERLEEFSDVGRAAFGTFGGYFTKVFQYSITLSVPCIYILLSGLNVHQMITQIHGVDALDMKVWILISGVVVALPVCLMKSLREVTVLALFGAATTVVVVMCVVVQGGIQYAALDAKPTTALVRWEGLPIAMATIAFSYGGNVVYPHVEATMRNPGQWNRAMLFAVVTITAMYLAISIPGYLYFGDNVSSPILDSLPPGAGSLTSYVLITLHVLLAAPIYLCSFCMEQERWLKVETKYMSAPRELMLRVAIRGSVTTLLTIIAMFVPYFSDLMGLVGAVASCLVVFLIPVACHYKLYGFCNRPLWHHFAAILVVKVGLVGLILGSISALDTLAGHIRSGTTVSHH